jgi:hypothetical protein
MIAADEALPTRAKNIIPKIIPQLYGLVHPTTTIPQVGLLRITEVGAKALNVTW